MFRATFLGHHGWLFSTRTSQLLVDPVFGDRFGFSDAVELRLFPPRYVDLAALPRLDAVALTHEHEGHFDLASLAQIDRSVPIYLSERSSLAARWVLEEMGFSVFPLYPGRPVQVGDLRLMPIATDQRHAPIEEWDDIAYAVRDAGGHGSFFSHSDMAPTAAMLRAAKSFLDRPGVWAYTNNHVDLHAQEAWRGPDRAQVEREFLSSIVEFHRSVVDSWAAPELVCVIGGGFAFGGELDWINGIGFSFDARCAARALSEQLLDAPVMAPLPGQTYELSGGQLCEPSEPTGGSFVRTLPEEQWPQRGGSSEVSWLRDYRPACGRALLADRDLEELQRELDEFARHLYGRQPFRALYSLEAIDLAAREPTFALSLKADDHGGAYVFEYSPQSCEFVPVECPDPVSTYLAVYECWATDLLAFLRADLAVNALTFGRSRSWNANPRAFFFDLNHYLFEFVHPLRQPRRALELYRRAARTASAQRSAPAPNGELASGRRIARAHGWARNVDG